MHLASRASSFLKPAGTDGQIKAKQRVTARRVRRMELPFSRLSYRGVRGRPVGNLTPALGAATGPQWTQGLSALYDPSLPKQCTTTSAALVNRHPPLSGTIVPYLETNRFFIAGLCQEIAPSTLAHMHRRRTSIRLPYPNSNTLYLKECPDACLQPPEQRRRRTAAG